MTSRDYAMVAKAIRERSTYLNMYILKDILIDELSEAFKNESKKFDEKKFRKACTSLEGR